MNAKEAGDVVHARVEKLIEANPSLSYGEGMTRVLAADPDLAVVYADIPKPETEMIGITPALEAEIVNRVRTSFERGTLHKLGGALGQIARKAKTLATSRGIGIGAATKIVLGAEQALANQAAGELTRESVGEKVDNLAQAYMQSHHVSYLQAVHAVLDRDQALKAQYART